MCAYLVWMIRGGGLGPSGSPLSIRHWFHSPYMPCASIRMTNRWLLLSDSRRR